MGTISSLVCFSLIFSQPNSGLGQGFVQAANKGEAAFQSFLKENLSNYSDGFAQRLQGFRTQATPLAYIRAGFKSEKLERHLVRDKEGQELTLTLHVTAGTPLKIEGLFITGPETIDQKPPKDYSGWTSLQDLAESLRKDSGAPAVGICVMQRGGQAEVAATGIREYGKEDRVSSEEVWQMGSIGKSMTATLIARLIEKGLLKWTSTVGEVLPGLEMKPEIKAVTLAELLRHRSGIPQDMGFTRAQVMKIAGEETDPRRLRMRYVKDVLGRDLLSKPGTKFAYSNAGYSLAGVIAEEVTGRSFEVLMKEEVFSPLGMTTAMVGKLGLPKARPFGHLAGEKAPQPHEIEGALGDMLAPAGGISCSLRDLASYGMAHLKGLAGEGSFLKKETFQELHRGLREAEGGPLYACGWSVGPLPGTALRHGHNGSNGTFTAELAFFPAEGLVAASTVNQGGEMEPSIPLQTVLAVARKHAPRKG